MAEFRKATRDDAAPAAQLLHLAQGGASVPVHGLGKESQALRLYEWMFRKSGTFWSYDMTTVAIEDNRVVGLISYYPSELQRDVRSEYNSSALGTFFNTPDRLGEYCDRAQTYHDGTPPAFLAPGLYVMNLAVMPAYRRRGIADRLLGIAAAARVRWECEHSFLHVEDCNAAAINLFATRGFVIKARGFGAGCRALCGFDGYLLMTRN